MPSEIRERSGSLGFEQKLWAAADLLRNNVSPSDYKDVVLGLLFLKFVNDAFEERRSRLVQLVTTPGTDYHVEGREAQQLELSLITEDRDEFTAEHVFWVPPVARWSLIQQNAHNDRIALESGRVVNLGGLLDEAMIAVEKENPVLKGALPKVFAQQGVDQESLGKLVDLFSDIGLGTEEHRAKDTLGRVYEYFLGRFAAAEGRGGGEFYTPESVVRLLVEMLEPYSGRIYDPACGSGGMFVQSAKFIEAHGGRRSQISVFGQESNPTTWRLARLNLAVRGIEANLGDRNADTFRHDLHPDLKADFVLANPPFNVSQWHGERLQDDVRWRFGSPPPSNANFAWVQHFVHHLAPTGTAGFVLANGSLSSQQSGEGEIRRRLVEADLVDCIVALPTQLFYTTQIPVSLWILARSKGGTDRFRDRRGETLFIDARKLGEMETRVNRVLTEADLERIAGTYHAWRNADGAYEDVAGFCKSADRDDIAGHGFVLTPGRYVGNEAVADDGKPFDEQMKVLTATLLKQIEKGAYLDAAISNNLRGLGYAD